MKLNKLLVAIMVSVTLFSCEDYLDINTDPNNPTSVTPNLVLPTAQNYTAQYISGNRRTNHLANVLMYNWSETFGFAWYNDEFLYQVNTSFYATLFDQAYSNALKQYHVLDTQYEGEEFVNYRAIGKIMKAFHFQYLVDLYGDVPYSEALGRSVEATPAYDDAQAIYDDLIVQLDEAIELINSVENSALAQVPGDDDGMFQGDMSAWKRFANTLKLRILVRESDVASNNQKITDAIAAINAEGSGYITEDVAIDLGYLNEEGKQNPFWSAFGFSVDGTVTLTNDATCATQWILDYLTNTSDARIDFLYEEPADGHMGINQGAPQTAAQSADFVSNIGPGLLKGADQASMIFTVAESRFLLAEASLKGYQVGGTPEVHYNAGVQASFNQLGAGSAAAYLTQPIENVNYAASSNKLEAIITQKWLATNGTTAAQSWFDYNRTGFPSNLPVSMDASTADRPVRLFYPASELNTNAGNVPDQPNAFTSKIFWAN